MDARPQGLRPLGAIMAGMARGDAPLGRAIAAALAVDFSSESLDHPRRGLADLDEAGRTGAGGELPARSFHCGTFLAAGDDDGSMTESDGDRHAE